MRRLALLFLFAACDSSGNVVDPNGMCPNGVCPVSDALQFAAEVVPISTSANAAAPPSQEIGIVSITNRQFTLTLDRATTLTGTVMGLVDLTQEPVKGGIVLTRPSRITGRPDVSYQTKIGDDGSWSLVVSLTHDGEAYTLRVLPEDDSRRPPQTFLLDGSRDREFALQLADSKDLLQIHGTITNAVQLPVKGMQVQAIDPHSKVSLSTVAVTDALGNFVVRLAPDARAYGNASEPAKLTAVQLVATPSEKGTWLPRLEMPVDITNGGPANSLTVNLAMPPLPTPAQLVYSVVGLSPSGKEVQIVGAHCQFTADVSDPRSEVRAFYDVGADTDVDGKATVMLIPAGDINRDYQVAVSPPSSSDFQATNTSISVGPSGGVGASIMLAQRSQVTGQVRAPDGSAIRGLTVIPTPATVAAALLPSQSALMPKLASALTDGEGRFVLRVDNGGYDFGLIPPATTGLPRVWMNGQLIATDTQLAPIALPLGSRVAGQVNDAAGLPLGGADVRVYSLAAHNETCPTADYTCLSPPRLIAEGTVLPDGSVTVLLPGDKP